MCGELDEQVLVGQEMLDRFRAMASGMDLPDPGEAGADPVNLADADGRAAYMDRLFKTGLARALGDISRADDDETVDALALQAIALARLAGFLAGQLPPEADLFRALIEAMSAGHAEPKERLEEARRARDHHHGHHHDHHHH
jgi:hypothetical protein